MAAGAEDIFLRRNLFLDLPPFGQVLCELRRQRDLSTFPALCRPGTEGHNPDLEIHILPSEVEKLVATAPSEKCRKDERLETGASETMGELVALGEKSINL